MPIKLAPIALSANKMIVTRGYKAQIVSEFVNSGFHAIRDPEDHSTCYVSNDYVDIQEIPDSEPFKDMTVAQSFVQFLKLQVGKPYVYGTAGLALTQTNLNYLINTYGSSFYKNARNYIGQQTFDCSGLIAWASKKSGMTFPRSTADYLYHGLCIDISKDQLQPGDLMFRQGNTKITHVAAYIGNNEIVEARGQDYNPNGVQQRQMPDTFQKFGRLKVLSTGVSAVVASDNISMLITESDIPTSYTVTSTYDYKSAPKSAQDKVKAINGNLLLYYNNCVLYSVEVKSLDKRNNNLVIKWAPLNDLPTNVDLEYEVYVY